MNTDRIDVWVHFPPNTTSWTLQLEVTIDAQDLHKECGGLAMPYITDAVCDDILDKIREVLRKEIAR